MRDFSIVLASGSGMRFGSKEIPKHLTLINNVPSIIWTLKNIIDSQIYSKIIIVTKESNSSETKKCISDYYQIDNNNIVFAIGANTRMNTFFEGLRILEKNIKLNCQDLLHLIDANRPFTPSSQYIELSKTALLSKCACPVRGIVDGIALVKDNQIIKVPLKSEYFHFVTPEVIEYGILKKSNSLNDKVLNSLVEYALAVECKPNYIYSTDLNHKLTYKEDLSFFEQLIKKYNINF